MLWGNHDIVKQNKKFAQKNLFEYYNPLTQKFEPLYNNIKIHEGLILRYRGSNYRIFVVHGHQGDLFNDRLWRISRIIVRCLWRRIEILRRCNLISPARNISRRNAIEEKIMHWIKANNQMVITGHTHHASFAKPGEVSFFNTGCCVKSNHITGIEIKNGEIALVKWNRKLGNDKSTLITRDIIAGPEKIINFF